MWNEDQWINMQSECTICFFDKFPLKIIDKEWAMLTYLLWQE